MVLGTSAASVTLAADPKGDPDRGGVSGEGAVPANLAALLTAREGVTATYGTQSIGPLPPVPADLARDFQSGCTD